MDEYEESYDLEEQYETEPDEAETESEEMNPEETETEPEEPSVEDETGWDEDQTEERSEDDGQEAAAETENGTEDAAAEGSDKETDEETVSGNELVISGDAVIFPEDYDFSALAADPVDTEPIVQAIEKQNDNMTAGFVCTSFLLGLLAGAMIIAGFRLRRV
ncbi:MAG: hypothetical protein NC302_02805 [Bacteroidales bacterium]|nr:hypothetical protein [Bacteroidales bacterium]MCM1414620.1 hypothetical protein [bacterium]MCM1423885.1 hypothetical protein [bacterium]